jgi:polyhydroxyalkanoate synthase
LSVPAAEDAAALVELTQRIAETTARLRQARDVRVGCSAKSAVWRCGKTTLYRYLPLEPVVAPRASPPVLICFALVNRPYVLDLQPDRSLVRRLLEAGHNVYLIDWGDPDETDRHISLEDYIERHLDGSVRHILASERLGALDLLGVCQGGVLSLCYTALHPERVARLVTLTAPVDFHTPENLLSKWVRHLDTQLLEACGNVPGEMLNAMFLGLMPFRLMQEKYVRLLTARPDPRAIEDFVRMEKWIFDSPAQAGTALAQFVRWFYQENRLVRGALELAGRPVLLREVRQPLLSLYALGDHIIPASACAALRHHVGSEDYTERGVATGHIGMYVSRAARTEIAERIIAWLGQHTSPARSRKSRRAPLREPGQLRRPSQ